MRSYVHQQNSSVLSAIGIQTLINFTGYSLDWQGTYWLAWLPHVNVNLGLYSALSHSAFNMLTVKTQKSPPISDRPHPHLFQAHDHFGCSKALVHWCMSDTQRPIKAETVQHYFQ